MVQGLNRAAAFAAAAAARLRPTKSAFRGASHSDHYRSQDGCESTNRLYLSPSTWVGTLALGLWNSLFLGKTAGVRDLFLWAAKSFKEIPRHPNPLTP